MGCWEATFVDKSTFDFPIFLLCFNAKFPIFPIFSILSFLFSYFLSNHAAGHPEIVTLGSEPLSCLDFQSREIFQHAFRRGGVDFFLE